MDDLNQSNLARLFRLSFSCAAVMILRPNCHFRLDDEVSVRTRGVCGPYRSCCLFKFGVGYAGRRFRSNVSRTNWLLCDAQGTLLVAAILWLLRDARLFGHTTCAPAILSGGGVFAVVATPRIKILGKCLAADQIRECPGEGLCVFPDRRATDQAGRNINRVGYINDVSNLRFGEIASTLRESRATLSRRPPARRDERR